MISNPNQFHGNQTYFFLKLKNRTQKKYRSLIPGFNLFMTTTTCSGFESGLGRVLVSEFSRTTRPRPVLVPEKLRTNRPVLRTPGLNGELCSVRVLTVSDLRFLTTRNP